MLKKGFMSLLIGLLFWVWLMPHVSASGNQLVIINKSTNNLIFYENDKAIALFNVATGRSQSLTPEGEFQIVNKIKNRPYYKEEIPGGDPSNPLGDRWLGINPYGTQGNTYAIHGNSNPHSIGTYASAGCVRMHNEQVQWLFERIEVSAPVLIVSSESSFDTIADEHGYTVTGADEEALPIGGSGNLSYGNIGEKVEEIQEQLVTLGYRSDDTKGSFRSGTEESVKEFQKDNQLAIDGIVGPETRSAMESNVEDKYTFYIPPPPQIMSY
ncbi:L,D-transpeptidase family protein [Salipaludibacillus sp. HK11]|uniref:L,D-transpeptidase family protein n=1 Tax=Salipaludibacillus sp. HK11 TaxID=3394320 RepID=UPI0039FC8368